jgi:hypothetical protein
MLRKFIGKQTPGPRNKPFWLEVLTDMAAGSRTSATITFHSTIVLTAQNATAAKPDSFMLESHGFRKKTAGRIGLNMLERADKEILS